jgi:hypothetical protein
MLPWFHDASSGLTSFLIPWSCSKVAWPSAWPKLSARMAKSDEHMVWRHHVRFASRRSLFQIRICPFLGAVPLAVSCAYPALCLGFRLGPFQIHCRIPWKPKMQARCNIVAGTFARHTAVLGSIPGGELSFFADSFIGFKLSPPSPSTIMVRQTGTVKSMPVKGGSPHLAASLS